jgi:hypothetical protein
LIRIQERIVSDRRGQTEQNRTEKESRAEKENRTEKESRAEQNKIGLS